MMIVEQMRERRDQKYFRFSGAVNRDIRFKPASHLKQSFALYFSESLFLAKYGHKLAELGEI